MVIFIFLSHFQKLHENMQSSSRVDSFSTTINETLTLVEKKILPNMGTSGISLSRPVIVYDKYPYLNFWSNMWGNSRSSNEKIYKKSGEIILLDNIPLQYGNTRVTLQGYSLLNKTPFVWSGSVYIDRTRDLGGKNLVSLSTLRSIGKMQFRVKKWQKVKPEYYVTTPSGDILEYTFPKNYIGTDGYLKTGILIKQSFQFLKQASTR